MKRAHRVTDEHAQARAGDHVRGPMVLVIDAGVRDRGRQGEGQPFQMVGIAENGGKVPPSLKG